MDMVTGLLSSVIVSTALASLIVAFCAPERVTLSVSSGSSVESAIRVTGTDSVRSSPGVNVITPVPVT